jgi:LacI family transcriptional regulator
LPTISDVAKRAGVSPVTVSRVINDAPNVNPATREHVEKAIDELGYIPNILARSLRSKRTRSLALIVPEIANSFWTAVARGVEDAAQSRGYSVLFCDTDENSAKQLRYLEVIAGQRVDGVIIAPCNADIHQLKTLRDGNIPTVLIDRCVEGWDGDMVHGDSVSGAYALTKHLIRLGHRCIAVISGPVKVSTAEDRIAGYKIALEEAGIPFNPQLIKRGAYRSVPSEHLTLQLLDEGLGPTAIFATNNTIAGGVMTALEKRGLRIPQDIALVCFDDLPLTAIFLPFLTCIIQPAYEMGLNGAQLLFSRLEMNTNLKPRHVVLPSRLLIRYSCGNWLKEADSPEFTWPVLKARPAQSILVAAIPRGERGSAAGEGGLQVNEPQPVGRAHSDVRRLLDVLQHREADRVPVLEFAVPGKAVFEYVLERKLEYCAEDADLGKRGLPPEDQVEFARRLGMDAVSCHFSWQPNFRYARTADGEKRYAGGTVDTWTDLDDLEPSASLADQLTHLERYLRAAQGTGVGVVACFTSFFDSALLAAGPSKALSAFPGNRRFLEGLMDVLLAQQEKVLRALCDRFAGELAFVLISDDIANRGGLLLPEEPFREIFGNRMRRLIAPAEEYGKLLALHSGGKLDPALPILHELGFRILYPGDPDFNDVPALKKEWAGRLALVEDFSAEFLARAGKTEIEERVRNACERLAPGGGYVLGTSGGGLERVPPENFVAMTRAVHRYGRYGSLGRTVDGE